MYRNMLGWCLKKNDGEYVEETMITDICIVNRALITSRCTQALEKGFKTTTLQPVMWERKSFYYWKLDRIKSTIGKTHEFTPKIDENITRETP